MFVSGGGLIILTIVHFYFLKDLGLPFSLGLWIFGPIFAVLLLWSCIVWQKGGAYRAIIQEGTLTVESPDESMFGESREIPLSNIEKLEIRDALSEGVPEEHWIIVTDGSEFCLDGTWCCKPYLDAKKLFQVITKLDNRIPIEAEQSRVAKPHPH